MEAQIHNYLTLDTKGYAKAIGLKGKVFSGDLVGQQYNIDAPDFSLGQRLLLGLRFLTGRSVGLRMHLSADDKGKVQPLEFDFIYPWSRE